MRAYFAALALVVAAVVGVLGLAAWRRARLRHLPPVAPAAPQVAPAIPLPVDVPSEGTALWIGEPGDDVFGYPKRQVDEAALQAIVRAQQFDRAERVFAGLLAEYEADFRKELWLRQAVDAFSTADPALTSVLDAWVARSPTSYAAHAARGSHRQAVAWAQRGHRYMAETALGQKVGFAQTMQAAADDFERALRLSPHFYASHASLITIERAQRGVTIPAPLLLKRALVACPLCTTARSAYLGFERPVWSGSPERAEALLTSWQAEMEKNPRLKLLKGYVHEIRCDMFEREKQSEAAFAECDRAVRTSPGFAHFLVERAHAEHVLKRVDRALADLDEAHRLDPQNRTVLERRPVLLILAKRYREAVDDLLRARRLDPVDVDLAEARMDAVKRLVYAGWEASKAGDNGTALSLFDMALELDPQNKDARKRRIATTTPEVAQSAAKALEERIAANPDDFGLHRQLDDVYLRDRRFPDIIAMWTKFLAKHPDHGLAFWERAGAYHHHGDAAHAIADARDACRLGVAQACAVAGKR